MRGLLDWQSEVAAPMGAPRGDEVYDWLGNSQ